MKTIIITTNINVQGINVKTPAAPIFSEILPPQVVEITDAFTTN